MAHDTAVTGAVHPSPHRRDGVRLLLLALAAVPLIWGIRLAASFALASHFCFPADLRRYALPGSLAWIWPTMVGLDLLSILAAATAALLSYRALRPAAAERSDSGPEWMRISEGRTRFLSIWALLASALFILLGVFDLIALWIVPICA